MPSVSIAVQQDILERFSDLVFKQSQALAEFIDNAIQSYLDHRNNNTFYTPDYKLKVDIEIEWDETKDHKTFARSITIRDNAAGISKTNYDRAFETGHRPEFNQGLNEYGMGMKVAAFWLSKKWTTKSKYFAEPIERTLVQDLDEIVAKKHKSLEYTEKSVPVSGSYTEVRLENLHQKNNFTKAKLSGIKEELASIYRAFLRRGEIQININGESLVYEDLELLHSPYYANPQEEPFEWKVQISKSMFGKEISGYIGILDEMSEKHSGLVVMRRGRVIVGESVEHLFHPSCIFGTYQNSHKYKRIYGEIEIKGFDASFNKNGFSNLEELETMLDLLKSSLKVNGYDLIKQAENLRMYKVQWDFGVGQKVQKDKYFPNTLLNVPDVPIRSGYVFKGWTPAPTLKVNDDANYTARWEEVSIIPGLDTTYTVRWSFNNGELDRCDSYKSGQQLEIPANPIKASHIFLGWSPTPKTIVDNNAVYSALWKADIKPVPVPPKKPENPNALTSKSFNFEGKTVKMDVIAADELPTLLEFSLENFDNKNVIVAKVNLKKIPYGDKIKFNSDMKAMFASLVIATFKAQMKGNDSCVGLLENFE